MKNKLIISENEKKRIRGLYEQITPQMQGTFQFDAQGLTPYVIVNVNGISAQDLYNNTINWIKTTWKNPDKVIKMTIPHEKIRIETSSDIGQIKNITFPYIILIEISFKEGKFKFEPIQAKNPQSEPNQDLDLIKFPSNIPNEGMKVGGFKFKREKIIDNLTPTVINLQTYLNNCVKDLSNYIVKKKADW